MNSLTNKDGQELITESQCIVMNSEHYMRVDWYAEDPHPEDPEFDTVEFGKVPLGCEDAEGTPICPAYALCKQVKTYERGVISEPLCVLPDDEVEEFAIPISRKVMSTDACKRVD